MECPLVQLAEHRKILKKFDQNGKVAIPVTEWMRFFERRADIRPEQIELFDG